MRLFVLVLTSSLLAIPTVSSAEVGSRIDQKSTTVALPGKPAKKQPSVGSSSPISKCGGFKSLDLSSTSSVFEGLRLEPVRASSTKESAKEAVQKPGCSTPVR